MRFYGFDAGEIVDETVRMLPLDIDPKLAWALRHRDRFPLDVNRASREDLLRVPGFGTKAVDRIIATRRVTAIRAADLARLHIPANKALPFIVLSDHRPPSHLLDGARLAERFRPKATQLEVLGFVMHFITLDTKRISTAGVKPRGGWCLTM